MSWKSYGLDQIAHKLVLQARSEHTQKSPCLQEAYKMRESVTYGLERFWGEHLRHKQKEPLKSKYWKNTWDALVKIMSEAGVVLPNDSDPEVVVRQFWGDQVLDSKETKLTLDHQRIALAVLTQLCDCMVWWTQRYKGEKE